MSYLGGLIKEIINKASQGESVAGAMHAYKAEIEKQLITLYLSSDLRIFDKDKGGILRGPVNSRKYEVQQNGKILIGCDPKYIKDNKLEVPYSRALFNSRNLGIYQLIAYEAPLMRKLTKNANPEISGRQISCDLVGINKNEICCIEVKVQPFIEGCRPSYALLEGFAYCVCLNWLIRINPLDLSQEIDLCCNSFDVKASNLPEKVTFAIAAPIDDYFMPYWRMQGQSDEWFRRRKSETEVIESAIVNHFQQYFAGYIAIATPSNMIETKLVDGMSTCFISEGTNSNSTIVQPFAKKFNNFFHEI